MRFIGVAVATVVALVGVAGGSASADKKIVDMTPGFEREAVACETQESGLAIVLGKTRTYVTTNPPDKSELEKDIERLANGHEIVGAYCKDVRAMVALLKQHAAASYRSVEKAIDTQDNVVRKARREGKKQIEELAPITRKLIPKINARVTQVQEKKPTGKFPSGRVVELPQTGAWKLGGNLVTDVAEYTANGITATVTTRPFTSATCDQQRKLFVAKAGDEPIADLELSAAAKAIDVQWAGRYVRRDRTPHLLTMMCVPAGTGGFVAISDLAPPGRAELADELAKLMVAMLALQVKR